MNIFKLFSVLTIVMFLVACNSNPAMVSYSQRSTASVSNNPDVMIMQGNITGLSNYLNTMPDINKKTDGNFTLLHKAVMFDKPKSAELLIKRGASPNSKGMIGVTPVFYAKSIIMLELLIKNGADIYIKNDSGMSLFYFITEPVVIRALIEKGLDPTDQGNIAVSPADAAKQVHKAYGEMDQNVKDNPAVKVMISNVEEKIKILEAYESLPELLLLAKNGDLKELRVLSKKKSLLKTTNSSGNTALHIAAQYNQLNIVKYLSRNKTLLNATNKSGKNSLDLVISSKSASAKYLSCQLNKYCKNVTSFDKKITQACSAEKSTKQCLPVLKQDIHGVFAPANAEELVLRIRFNESCKKFNYIKCKQLEETSSNPKYERKIFTVMQNNAPRIDKRFEIACGITGKKSSCLSFIKTYPGYKSKPEIDTALAYLSQKCKIKEDGWIYKGSSCNAGFAHGSGSAINNDKNLSYSGAFQNGHRVNGKVKYNGQPMYDGKMKQGKPNGLGICFHEGEPEECKYYEGKRVDSLYKQRIEMAKQQKIMDEKLAKMQQAQSAQYKQMQIQMRNTPAAAKSKDFGDVIIEEGQRRVVNKIFDSLF
ncbi:MAG: hypothetical protein DIZ80_06650 [endosymbiont of Galathealinum brachiosum]|uniref:Uncharacterized protein n=1 Tax=endosymbiont of Galathealinum brachiosum TaxID=2200906 RepID=A0A370DG53_9GAMM|nr:MAG: hypothetical protein DIZ80_06650 [endosymbiont of Galathealinum brachiosum]